MNYYRYSVMLVLSLGITGCAMTPGLQTYDLPQQGSYKTDQGAELNVVPLTQIIFLLFLKRIRKI